MLRLPIFLSLLCVCSGLDLNGGLTKKYAFTKIMSGCLGEDFVMMVKEQMMKACSECHGRDSNNTQINNLDYLINSIRSSQQPIPMPPPTQMNPMYVYQPFVYPIFLQSPYSASPFPQFPAQNHHGQQNHNAFSQHGHRASSIPHEHDASPFAQFGHQQHNTFSHHDHNVPNIPRDHHVSNHQDQLNPLSPHHPSLQAGYHPFNVPNNPNIPNGQFDERSQDDWDTFYGQNPNSIGQLTNQDNLSTNGEAQNPLPQNIRLRSPFPNNQLGYPSTVHTERQSYELNPQPVEVEAQKRKKRSLPLSPENLETLKNNLSIKIGNMTCVFKEMGWLTEENNVNFTFIEQQIKNLNLDMRLQEDLIYIHETCKDFSMCMPSEKSKHPLMREMGDALSYMKCMNTKAVTACMKHDFRMYQAKMGYGSLDTGLPIEMENLLGNENTNPSQLADDIGSLVFADDAQLPL